MAREALSGRKVHLVVCSRGESASRGRRPCERLRQRGRRPTWAPPLNSLGSTGMLSLSQARPCAQACRHHQAPAAGHRPRAHARREPAPGPPASRTDREGRGQAGALRGHREAAPASGARDRPPALLCRGRGGRARRARSPCCSTCRIPRLSRPGRRPWEPISRSFPRATTWTSSWRGRGSRPAGGRRTTRRPSFPTPSFSARSPAGPVGPAI